MDIPVQPAGSTGRPQPRLTLSYNSSAHDREAGYGWGLDLPVIELKPLSGNPCFNKQDGTPIACWTQNIAAPPVTEERYTYNGQPLVFICQPQNANDPHCGTPDQLRNEPQPEWASGGKKWRYFRLQVEGQFSRFYLSENRRYWRVQLKGGELLEFGEPPNSGTVGIEHPLGNENAVLRWRLVRHSDAVHKVGDAPVNYIDYHWSRLGGKRGLLYLTDIYDTPRADYPGGDADFAHHTKLFWEAPDFPQTFYADPYRATPDLRLARVAVASIPWSGTGPREIIRTYLLKYAPVQGTEPVVPTNTTGLFFFQLWRHSFLSMIGMQGRCGQFEDYTGRIPSDRSCPDSHESTTLPPTTFEYQGANSIAFGAAFITKVHGGPWPPKEVDENGVLPDLNSVGVVDFNRDGLPDIVQGWKESFATDDAQFLRPITGYLNRGPDSSGVAVTLAYQCMDAGTIDDPTGLTHYNVGRAPGFFTNTGGVTLPGAWGEGVVAWGNAQYAPYRAVPLLRGSKPGEFEPGTGCDDDHVLENFRPGWKWEKTQVGEDWAKLSSLDPDLSRPKAASSDSGFLAARFFADIDGDGLIDRLVGSGTKAFDFESADVEFTSLFAKNEPLPYGLGVGPAQIPFVSNLYKLPTYVDINGDGLVDLVTSNPNDNGGVPRVRPGDGHGHFWCENSQQPWPCQEWPTEPSSAYEINVLGPHKPWPFTKDTFFHDVTGDGLADIVQYDMSTGKVSLWVNLDGHTFACVTNSCVVGVVIDERTGTTNIGDHRITFADMHGGGTDDIVILTHRGAYIGRFMYTSIAVADRGWAPKPGLLTRVHNGYGATTDIQYHTIQQLDLEVKDTPLTWQYHSPVVESVVTQIVTQDSYHADDNSNGLHISAPFQFRRKAQYIYQNPAYDRWSRSFAGFRKVIAHYGDEKATTATTYWFGPCQNNKLDARLPDPELKDVPLCREGSDDDDYKSLTGRVVRIDRGTEFLNAFPLELSAFTHQLPQDEGPKLLWTKLFHYVSATLFDRPDRRVTFSYPTDIDTYLYDDAQPTQPGEETTIVAKGDPVAGGDALEDAPHQLGFKHLSRQVEYYGSGTLKRVTDRGAVKEDATTITLFSPKNQFSPGGPSDSKDTPERLPCTSDWQCLPDYVSIWEPQGSDPDKPLRKSHFTYTDWRSPTATGDVESVEGWLQSPSEPLQRHHPAGDGSIALKPAGQSLDSGWHTFATFNYDPWVNVTRTASGESWLHLSPPICTAIAYDRPYQHLPNVVRKFKDGWGGAALETQSVFDRGFEQVASSTAPNGGSSEIRYDSFGRPIEFYSPDPDFAGANTTPALAATIAYGDREPLTYVDVRRIVGPGKSTRSVSILNSLGEPVVAFDQGDNNDWVLNGWMETNETGQVEKVRRPWAFTDDPIATALTANAIPVPKDNSSFEIYYDDFGREFSIREISAGFSQELMRNSYFPLAVETRDAEQLKPGGPHEKAFQRVEFDGHGRSTRAVEHIENPTTDNIVTTVKYEPTGEPGTITRTHWGGTYYRTMKYDMLGRLMVNEEPNTGNNWRYVWDDAGRLVGTSDARGCGENFYYDGLGRLIGEDYSPCLASQPAYTSPNLATGEGLETFYRYDAYKADQVGPEPSFADDQKFALGKLVSVRDRGSHTRFNYDARGRVRRISRQMAKPEVSDAGLSYALHWFTSRRDYDLGDRLTRRTTGVDVDELLMNGASEERYAYSARGLPFSIGSSYGHIIENAFYGPDGAPNIITYGDYYGTRAKFEYDGRRRLDDLYRLKRIDTLYKGANGIAPWLSPFESEIGTGDRHPVPLQALPTRVAQQTFDYDGLGNLTASSDDLSAHYDRSLGPNLGYGRPPDGPNQLQSGEGLRVRYDKAGNLSELKIARPGSCPTGAASQCAQWFAYDWDEVGQLARARRWDFDGNALPPQASPDALPAYKPSWDLSYAYSQGIRVRKSVVDAADVGRHTLEVSDTLRVEQAPFDSTDGNYKVRPDNVHAYLGGMAHVFWDGDGQFPHQAPDSLITMHLVMGDHLGSSSVLINHANSELVERTTYQPYGAVESDYRPSKGKAFREPFKFTGKEEDIEVGATYFGARYYQPYLGRFMSADPLTIHGLGSDLNPYAYVGGRVMTHVDPMGLDGDSLDPPVPGTITRPNGDTVKTTCSPCVDRLPILEAATERSLETLNRGGNRNPSAPAPIGGDKKFLGLPPEGGSMDRMLEAQMKCKDEPACNAIWLVSGAGALAAPLLFTGGGAAAGGGGAALFARGGPSALALAAYVRSGLFVSAVTGGGGVSVVASNTRLGNYGVRMAPIYERVFNALSGNLRLVYQAQGINPNFVAAGGRYPGLAPAVFGKAFELNSVAATPNLVMQLGGANQPDAVIRYGNQFVNVDWTTWGQLGQHLARSYYQIDPFIFYLHPGLY